MSNYYISIDPGVPGDDHSVYCIMKRPSWLMRFINKVLKRGDTMKIVYCGPDPNQIKKWRYRGASIKEY